MADTLEELRAKYAEAAALLGQSTHQIDVLQRQCKALIALIDDLNKQADSLEANTNGEG